MGLISGLRLAGKFWSRGIFEDQTAMERASMTGLMMNRLLEQKLNDLNRDLKKYFERKVQLSQKRKSEALSYWEPIVDCIINYVKRNDDRFASLRRFGSGSYYERAKVREPNEFDLMFIFQDLTATSMVSFTRGPGMTVQTPLGRWWVAIHNNIDVAVRSKELELALRACSPVWGISRVRRVDGRAASASRREE